MEGSESEAIFESLNLKPQLIINEVLNSVDDLVDGAFNFFRQEASTILRTDGTDRSADLKKGVDYIHRMVQAVLDKRLGMWEKYCHSHCFAVPAGFSVPNANELICDFPVDEDDLSDQQLDVLLDSLRNKLAEVGKESQKLKLELRTLERQHSLSNLYAASVNEALHSYDRSSMNDMVQEMIRSASELRAKMEKLKIKRLEDMERSKRDRIDSASGDLPALNFNEGLLNVKLEELEEFAAEVFMNT
ncbi:hypothetical protein Nepgr_002894 [Nepenthes gracilis]|uniref:Protein MIS12 homolog n=1 Tax=Nepenthes gracilis TaxID=150966 RepID=A0AAD3RYL4_NEPGR|nr:hypothetical protein Nepgr_002894 [Nepenthes gracilis]